VAETHPSSVDRRRSPRIDLLAELHGHVVTLDERVQVTQMSPGGMTVETSAPLSTRLPHDFRISFGPSAITVRGQVVHNRVVVQGDGLRYVAGIRFAELPPEAARGIQAIIESACATVE
jgi:hypothetical protein